MDALDKTMALVRKNIPLKLLDKNSSNPNKMSARQFDLLVDNTQKTGMTDAILVRPAGNRFRIVGGHHRFDVAAYLGWEDAPCTVIVDPDFDEEAEEFQMVRMNMIRGRMDPAKFFAMYEKLSSKYSDAVLQDAFGFAEEAEFKKMIEQTAATLDDPVMKNAFKEAAKEVKTIDGLARVLNQIFTKYGDSLPFGFMVFDYAGQRSVWIQTEAKTMAAFDVIGEICRENNRTLDDVLGNLLQLIAKGEFKQPIDDAIKATKPAQIPKGLQTLPTKQNLEQFAAAV